MGTHLPPSSVPPTARLEASVVRRVVALCDGRAALIRMLWLACDFMQRLKLFSTLIGKKEVIIVNEA